MGLRYVKCNLCGSRSYSKLFTVKGRSKFSYPFPLAYVKCKRCGLVFTNPRPDRKEILKQYDSEHYRSSIIPKNNYILRREIDADIRKISFLERFKKKGRLLDVGCAQGFFIYIARMKGFKVYGVETSKRTSSFAKNTLKLDVFNMSFEKAKLKENYFDVITAFNLIEHLENPLGFLKKCYSLLKKHGILVIATPSLDSLHFKILGKRWECASDPAQHLYLFNKKTLSMLAKKAGFKIRHLKSTTGWSSIFSKTSAYENIISYLIKLKFRILSKLLKKEVELVMVCEK